MKNYLVIYRRGLEDKEIRVAARSIEKAVETVLNHLKKNEYNAEIRKVRYESTISLVQK